MRLKCIGCEVLARPLYLSAAYSPHTVDIEMLRYGLHQQSNDLRTRLQTAIDAAEGKGYDAVVLAYGLCGKSTEGLRARSIPLVLPRAHDCITIFLGSRQRYLQEFEQLRARIGMCRITSSGMTDPVPVCRSGPIRLAMQKTCMRATWRNMARTMPII